MVTLHPLKGADLVSVECEENMPPQGFNCNENAKYKNYQKTDEVLEGYGFPLLSDHEGASCSNF